ncbi:MAG: MBL fold metallo-hydrolase [Alphaproteobacteria bacterium]
MRYLVNFHLHFDHAGGNHQVKNAQLVIQHREWHAGHDADLMAANGYVAADYDHGHDLKLVEGEHDLFGDGSVVCVPTNGHTPGHQSLQVRLAGGDVLLTGDACYLRQTLENLHLPASCMTAGRCWTACAASAPCKPPARGFSVATARNSGRPCRKPRRRLFDPCLSG